MSQSPADKNVTWVCVWANLCPFDDILTEFHGIELGVGEEGGVE